MSLMARSLSQFDTSSSVSQCLAALESCRQRLFYAMGGSVSAGRSNDELVDNLVDAEFIRSPSIQRVFRAVDRGNYYHPNHKQNAYKDIAWKMGNLHLSAPCVYSVVMESLKLKPGLSFLNLGSGSGYLSTMVGLILGRYGTNHGIEFHNDIVDYAYERLDYFLKHSKIVDETDFCEPVFTVGNCLSLESNCQRYDRVYCGAACPEEYENYVRNLVKVNGILIMPLNDKLLKITRVDEDNYVSSKILSVSFAPLILPPMTKKGEVMEHSKLSDVTPANLKQLCRFRIRSRLRNLVEKEHKRLFRNRMFDEIFGAIRDTEFPDSSVAVATMFYNSMNRYNPDMKIEGICEVDTEQTENPSTTYKMPDHNLCLTIGPNSQLSTPGDTSCYDSYSKNEDDHNSVHQGNATSVRVRKRRKKYNNKLPDNSAPTTRITRSKTRNSPALLNCEPGSSSGRPSKKRKNCEDEFQTEYEEILSRICDQIKHKDDSSSDEDYSSSESNDFCSDSNKDGYCSARRYQPILPFPKSFVKLDSENKIVKQNTFSYYLTRKIEQLPLPFNLLDYVNYERNNF